MAQVGACTGRVGVGRGGLGMYTRGPWLRWGRVLDVGGGG